MGIGIGAAQVVVLKLLGGLLLGDRKAWIKVLAAALLLIKIALIVCILYLIYGISMVHLIWTAGGMLVGLIAVSVINIMRQKKSHGKDNCGD